MFIIKVMFNTLGGVPPQKTSIFTQIPGNPQIGTTLLLLPSDRARLVSQEGIGLSKEVYRMECL